MSLIWFTRFLTPNFTQNHVSSNLLRYLQVVPCHLWLRARFHIRFKRRARRVGQVRPFSMKSCVKNTSKTCHEDFSLKLYRELSRKRSPFSIKAVRSIFLEKQISFISCVARKLCTYMKTSIRLIRSFFLARILLEVKVYPSERPSRLFLTFDVTLKDKKEKKLSSKEIPLQCRSWLSNPSRRLSETPKFKKVGRFGE